MPPDCAIPKTREILYRRALATQGIWVHQNCGGKETGDVPGLRERHLRLRIPKGVEILSGYPSL